MSCTGSATGTGRSTSTAGYILQYHAATFGEFPPCQAPANFNPQEMLGSVLNAAAKGIGNT